MRLILAGIIGIFLVMGCLGSEEIDPTVACKMDSVKAVPDCVPAQCCHPSSCVNFDYAPDCTNTVCTMSCEGPIDCGAGSCGCVNGKCEVIPND